MTVSLEGVYSLIDRASPTLRNIERRAQAADRALDKLGRTMDKMEARKLASDVSGLTGNLGKLDQATQRVDRTTNRHVATQRVLRRATSDSTKEIHKAVDEVTRFEKILKRVAIAGAGLRELLIPEKFILVISALKPAIAAVAALGAGATALVQQVGQATGALVPLVARAMDLAGAGAAAATALLSVKAAAVVTKFAMSGVQQAIQGNVNAFKQLTPQARAFVLEMRKLQPVINTLRGSAQKGLFSGLTQAVRTVRAGQALPVLNQASAGMGSAVGQVAQNAAVQLTDPQTLRDFTTVSNTAQGVVTRLGDAATHLARAFLGLLSAAAPLTTWLTKAVDTWAKYIDQQIRLKTQTGDLQRYFERTRAALTNVGHAMRDFASGIMTILHVAHGETDAFGSNLAKIGAQFRRWTEDIHNQASVATYFEEARAAAHRFGAMLVDVVKILSGLGRASRELGQDMTGGLLGSLDRFSDWVNSFKGQNVIAHWMEESRATLSELWGLVGDLAKAFGLLSDNGGGAADLIAKIRTLIPDLTKVLTIIAEDFGPPLQNAIAQIFHLFVLLTDNVSSPVAKALTAFSDILSLVNAILDKFTGLQHVLGSAFELVLGAILINKIQKLVTGVDLIALSWRKVKANTDAASVSASTYGTKAATAGAEAGAASTAGRTGVPGMMGILGGSSKLGRLGTGLTFGAPLIAGLGTQALASSGVISQGTSNVANSAILGASIGTAIEPGLGTIIGGGLGLGFGLLEGGGKKGPSAEDRYIAQIRNKGFDPTQLQGGAQNLAQANRYQTVLTQSRRALLAQRSQALGTGTPNAISLAQAESYSKQGGSYGKAVQPIMDLTKQLALNKTLTDANMERLTVERHALSVEKAKTAELNKQARAEQSRTLAARLSTQYGQAYNILRSQGKSGPAAVHQITQMMESRAKTLNPAGAQVLFQQGSAWLAGLKKEHPELQKEYDSWDANMKATLKKMGVTMATDGATVVRATGDTWKKLKQAMGQNPAEVVRQQGSKSFTALQREGVAVLMALGRTSAQATLIIQNMENGKPGPTAAQLVTAGNRAARAVTAAGSLKPPSATPTGPRRATGGRIGGTGLQDTVSLAGIAAPGELVVNRHTERKVNSKLARSGSTLGGLVAGETKRHSDILPGFAMGGRIGAAVAEANRIDSLHSKYVFGGGHVTPAPSLPPWDCSSSTSRVLQAAGYSLPTMTAAQFMDWGEPGPGKIGVEASPGHVYMMLNGRPWGTSYSNPDGGAGWIRNGSGYRPGFVQRHAPNPGAGGAGGGGGARKGSPSKLSAAQSIALGFQGKLTTGATGTVGKSRATTSIGSGGSGGTSVQNQTLAHAMMLASGWGSGEWSPLQKLWTRESGFSTTATGSMTNLGRAYGIPQSLPGNKMASAGNDWQTNPRTQIRWGLDYIKSRYGAPSAAWAHSEAMNPHWYAKGGRTPEWGGWHKDGLDKHFDRPTMIGVGESGREHVRVTPNGQSNSTGGISITVGDIIIQGGTNMQPGDIQREIEQALEEVARRLERQSVGEG